MNDALITLNPAVLHDPSAFGYAHTARAPSGAELVAIAGQYASGPDGRVVAPEFEAQVARAFENLGAALAAHELGFEHVFQMRTYVVAPDFARLGLVSQAVAERFGDRRPVNTLLGVASLAMPDMLFEVEALAVRA